MIDPKRKTFTVYRRSVEGAIRILVESTYTSITGVAINLDKIFRAN